MKTIISALRVPALAFTLAVLTGCAHNITINPAAPDAKASAQATKANKVAGLYISQADRAREVISPGGGGDKLSYFPYKDLEGPLFFTLGRVYQRVEQVAGTDAASASAKNVSILFAPELKTTSSSPSPLTWPPTKFSVVIHVKALDAAGTTLWEDQITGDGNAEFDEFKRDFPLAARRASADALTKLETVLRTKEGLN